MATGEKFVKIFLVALISVMNFPISTDGVDLVEPVPPFEESLAGKTIVPEKIPLEKSESASTPMTHNTNNAATPASSSPSFIITERGLNKLKNDTKTNVMPNGTNPMICDSNATIAKSVDETNCSRYYVSCARKLGKSNNSKSMELKSCPVGKYFDSIDLECVNKHAAECKPYVCKETGFFPDPKNPARFIHCLRDGPKRLHCEPEGTTFNNEAKACLWNAEEHPFLLRFFNGLLWLIKVTEENSGSLHGAHNATSTGYTKSDILKLVIVAIAIPVFYVTTVFCVYVQINIKRSKPEHSRDRYVSDAEEFHRFYTRPTPIMRSVSNTGSRIDISNLYQTPCVNSQRCSRVGDESNYSTTRM